MSCCGSTRIVSTGLANCDFNVTSGDSPTNVLSGPEVVGCNDTLHLWSAGGINFSVTPGSARVNIEPANITDDIANPGAPATPPTDITRPAVHFASDGIWVWDTVGAGWAFSAPSPAAALNIYNVDGSLTSTRTLDGNGNPLVFQNVDGFTVQGLGTSNIILDAGLGGDIQLLGTIIDHGNYSAIIFDNHPPTRDDTAAFTPQNFLYSGPSGELYSAPLTSLPSGANIYNADGGLTGNRVVSGGAANLTFDTINFFTVNAIQDIVLNGFPVQFSQYPDSRDDTPSFTPQNFLYTDTNGDVLSAPLTALPSPPADGNIYDNDGALAGPRTLDLNGNNLTFTGTGQFIVTPSSDINMSSGQIFLTSGGVTMRTQFIDGFQFLGGEVQFDQFPDTRDDTGTFTPANFLYTDATGQMLSAPVTALPGGGGNIYTTDGALTGPRTLDGNGANLTFDNLDAFDMNATSFNTAITGTITLSAVGPFGDITLQTVNSNIVLTSAQRIDLNGDPVVFNQYPESRDDTPFTTPQNFLYTDSSGFLNSAPISSISGSNIYTADGVLTGSRTFDGGGFDIQLDNFSGIFAGNSQDINDIFLLAGQTAGTGGSLQLSNTSQVQLASYGTNITLDSDGTTYAFNGPDAFWVSYPSTRDDTGAFTPANILYTDSSGAILSAPLSALPSGSNIYTADDTLTSNRTLDGGGNFLNFLNMDEFNVDGTGNMSIVGDGNVTLQSDAAAAFISGQTQTNISSTGPVNITATGTGPLNLGTANLQPINLQAAPGGDINLGSQPGLVANQVKIRAVGTPSDYDVVIGDSVQHLATDVDTGQLQSGAGNVKAIGHHSGTQNLRVDVTGLTDFMWFEIRSTGTFNAGLGGGSAIYRAHYNPLTGAVAVEESAANGDISLAFAGAVAGSLAFTVTPVPAGTDMRKTLELHMYGTELADEINVNFSTV